MHYRGGFSVNQGSLTLIRNALLGYERVHTCYVICYRYEGVEMGRRIMCAPKHVPDLT